MQCFVFGSCDCQVYDRKDKGGGKELYFILIFIITLGFF